MSIDDLLEIDDNSSRREYQDIKPNLAKKLRLASNLPQHDIKALTTFIDALLIKGEMWTHDFKTAV